MSDEASDGGVGAIIQLKGGVAERDQWLCGKKDGTG
jgi:hypothetical protein